jgi:hypothetical protein
VVNFADKRVQIKGAAIEESNLLKYKHSLFEVDLGELKSMKDNQIHIDEIAGAIEKGQQIVDDSVLEA